MLNLIGIDIIKCFIVKSCIDDLLGLLDLDFLLEVQLLYLNDKLKRYFFEVWVLIVFYLDDEGVLSFWFTVKVFLVNGYGEGVISIKGDDGVSELSWLDYFEFYVVVLSILKNRRAIKEIVVENFTFSTYDDKILIFLWQEALKLRVFVAYISSTSVTRNKLALFIYLFQTNSLEFDFLTFYYNIAISCIFQQMST